ncbi:MAG: hypothetical protein ABI747_02930 [Candidatus Moraniibacteriota bacterium]
MSRIPARRPRDQEDLHIEAELRDSDGHVLASGVPCKVFLPQKPGEMPYIEFLPSLQQYKAVERQLSVAFHAEHHDSADQCHSLDAEQLFLVNRSQRLSEGVGAVTLDGVAERLLEVQTFQRDGTDELGDLFFQLSPNELLRPGHVPTLHQDGTVEIHRMALDTFELLPRVKIQFDEHVRYRNEQTGDERRTYVVPELVVTVEKPAPALAFDEIEKELRPALDDFLLLASLATDCRTACMGWQYVGGNRYVREYSGNFGFPSGEKESHFHFGLIDPPRRALFLREAWTNFRKSPDQAILRTAIWILVPGGQRSLETGFLAKFAVLEGLLDLQAKTSGRETVISRADWNDLLPVLQEAIESARIDTPAEHAAQLRETLKEKLPELNRPRPRASFDAFCRETALDVSDLWIAFGSDAHSGLYQIRNKLIHGFAVPVEAEDALFVAEQHLHWTVARMLLRILNWDVNDSGVRFGSENLSLQPRARDMAQEQMADGLRRRP